MSDRIPIRFDTVTLSDGSVWRYEPDGIYARKWVLVVGEREAGTSARFDVPKVLSGKRLTEIGRAHV